MEGDFIRVLDELRSEYAGLEAALREETEAHKLQSQATRPLFLRVPAPLLAKIEERAAMEQRNRQNYIIKVLTEALGR